MNKKNTQKLLLAMALLGASPGFAQINIWTGTTSGNWNTLTNWSNNVVPNSTGTDVIFNSAGLNQATLNLNAATTIRGLYLFGGNYTLSPSASEVLTIAGGGFTQLGSGTFTVNNDITSTGTLAFNGTGGGAITLNSVINNNANAWENYTTSNVTLTKAYTSTNVSSTALRVRAGNFTLSGAGTVTQGAAAQIVLGAPSTYQAGVYHNNTNAALILDNTGTNNADRVTDANQVNILNRALIEFRGNASAASTETLGVLNSNGGVGSLIRVKSAGGQSARLTFASVRTNSGGIEIDTNGSPALFQYLVPTGDTLGAAGTAGGRVIFTTAPTLTNGVMRYSIVKDESTGGGATFATYDSTVDSGAALGVKALASYTGTDINTSTLTANTDITGGATLTGNREANALRINASGAGQSLALGSNTLALRNAAGLIYNGNGNDYTISNTSGTGVNFGLIGAGNASYVYINSNTLTIDASAAKTSEFVKAGDGALVINGAFNNKSARQLGVDDGAADDDMSINGAITADSGSTITKSGQGTLVLGGSGDNSALNQAVTISAGTLILDKSSGTLQNNALGSAAITLAGGTLSARNTAATFTNTLNLGAVGSSQSGNVIGGNAAITFSGIVQGTQTSQQTYALINNSSADLTLSGTVQAFNANPGASTTSFMEFSGSGTTKVTGVVQNGFANAITTIYKSGSGSVILSGNNTYTGNTQVNGGYLRLDSANALGAGNLLIVEANYASGQNAVVELGTGNTAFTRAIGTGAGQVNLGGSSGNAANTAGFASVNGTSTVNFGGAGAAATWGAATGFFGSGGVLVLGSPNVAGTLDLQNAINLGNTTTSNVTRTINTLNGSAVVDGQISGVIANASTSGTNNGILKTGLGGLAFTAANTYTGATTISAGTFFANNASGSATGTGAVSIASGATLSGTGTISGATTVSGNLNAGVGGSTTAVLAFGGALNLASAQTTTFNIASTTRNSGFDGIDVAGALTNGGALVLNFGSSFLAGGESFNLFGGAGGNAGSTGNFTSVSIAGSYVATLINSSGVWTGTGGGYDFTYTQATGDLGVVLSAVPEPATFAAFAGLGVLGLAALRRRRAA